MKNTFINGSIETINPERLTESELLKMYEIERDTWAYFMGEYVKCKDCDKIFSKKDIYLEIDSNYKEKTVIELEKEYGRRNIKCKCCNGETKDIRGEELIKSLELRVFGAKKSFINFYKGKVNEILGFSYGFTDTTEGIYKKEFSFHFTSKLLETLIKRFGTEKLLVLSGVCFKEKNINIEAIYELIKYFYCSIINDSDYISIGEAIKGTPSYKIYKGLKGKTLNIKPDVFVNKNDVLTSRIIYKEKVLKTFKQIENMNIKRFLRFIKKKH